MSNFISLSVANAATLLAAAAFLLGAAINASGRKAVQGEFVRYGFPSWWCWITAIPGIPDGNFVGLAANLRTRRGARSLHHGRRHYRYH